MNKIIEIQYLMRRLLIVAMLWLACAFTLEAQVVTVTEGRFQKGDNPAWSQASFDDSGWQVLSLEKDWNEQGVSNSHGYGWYRIHVVIPSSLKKGTTDKVVLDLGPIDDTDETWMNGVRVGKMGLNPEDPEGFVEAWDIPRRYVVASKLIKWDKENVIAVRVYNGGDPGGFYARPVFIGKPILEDFVSLTLNRENDRYQALIHTTLATRGTVKVVTQDVLTDKVIDEKEWKVSLSPRTDLSFQVATQGNQRVTVTYADDKFGETLETSGTSSYILTPPAPATPRYNGPLVFGVRPGSPVIFRLAFSGDKPMKYAVEGLPEGVSLDPDKGVLSGSVDKAGDYPLVFIARNAKGEARAEFTLKVGSKIALTPPMGWNSWNCWGLSVSQEKVMSSAAALINRGLADYGYCYMNIDDAWEAAERTPDGRIVTNEKFPDIKGLGDWLHSNGLKMGIYSSPGDLTCGSFLGSLGHELQDAETWNEWGVDYLKYDWCGYRRVFDPDPDHSVAAYARPYMLMQQYLRQQPRDIFYSLCQYGMADVWTWGHAVDANSWRTTGDITDTWASLYRIGFEQQAGLHPYSGPGHWNDPDMLVVGKVGWSNILRDSRLTPDEQYTHISLWSLLAANMLIGCDIAQIDDFTFNLLCNNEVNAVNQDILGKQAHQDVVEDGMQIWSRDLYDGGKAVGIFNLNTTSVPVDLAGCLGKIDIENVDTVRDLWRQKDIPMGTYVIPPHGVLYVKVKPAE